MASALRARPVAVPMPRPAGAARPHRPAAEVVEGRLLLRRQGRHQRLARGVDFGGALGALLQHGHPKVGQRIGVVAQLPHLFELFAAGVALGDDAGLETVPGVHLRGLEL